MYRTTVAWYIRATHEYFLIIAKLLSQPNYLMKNVQRIR